MEKENAKASDLYSDTQKQRDVEALNLAAENVVSNFGAAYALAERYNYPATAASNILVYADELIKEFFLLANYITNPAAADIVDDIARRQLEVEGNLAEAAGDLTDRAVMEVAADLPDDIHFRMY